jgi:hypothetical protein
MKKEEIKITDKVKTFEDACKVLGLDPKQLPVVDLLPEKDRKSIIAYYKLTVIIRALNEGWEPNWNDWNEYKYFNWFYLDSAGFGYAYANSTATNTYPNINSRLCFKSDTLARYARVQFRDLYFEYLFIELPKNYGK